MCRLEGCGRGGVWEVRWGGRGGMWERWGCERCVGWRGVGEVGCGR